ncbi:MAG: alpha/beta hydrolase [Anaerolineae bacterium]|nr:alpha/beta hydrolase [Anaerolineae bacterium]MDW8103006.1 alpha/beta hydrolase [Anaerolineae bacterium]
MPAMDISEHVCIHYEEVNPPGSPPVLLLHGLGSAGADWFFQFEALSRAGFRVLAPDLRGFGRSSAPPKITVKAMADDMAIFLKKLNAYPAHVVGISMGGAVALQLALDHRDLVSKLVLVNTFARMRFTSLREVLYLFTRLLLISLLGLEKQAEIVARRVFPHPGQEALRNNLRQRILHTNPYSYRSALKSLQKFNVFPRLKELNMPVLVVTGAEDTTVHPKVQEEMARAIPGAKHIIVEGSGHGIIADNPEAFNRILLEFLKG